MVLTGFMGTGKSTVGRILAQRLDYQFVDTDALIVVRNGRSIADIFAQDGEEAFRQMEADVARELGQATGLIVATGGRLLLDDANAAALGQNGRIFCLTASPETIYRRVKHDRGRPLLNVPDPRAKIQELLDERAQQYGRFQQIDTEKKTAKAVAEEIIKWLSTM